MAVWLELISWTIGVYRKGASLPEGAHKVLGLQKEALWQLTTRLKHFPGYCLQGPMEESCRSDRVRTRVKRMLYRISQKRKGSS